MAESRLAVRRQVEADHHGEIVAIDVDSGSWAVADGEVVAVERLREMRPRAVNVLCERVGYRALRSFGAGVPAEAGVIQGAVNDAYEAVVAISLQSPEGPAQEIEAVIDTGYSGFLTLPTLLVTGPCCGFGDVPRRHVYCKSVGGRSVALEPAAIAIWKAQLAGPLDNPHCNGDVHLSSEKGSPYDLEC